MVDIYLDRKQEIYRGSNELIVATTSNCDSLGIYQMVNYKIQHRETYESSSWSFWWHSSKFTLNIRPSKGSEPIYMYYCGHHGHLVTAVEVYYSDLCLTIPLIIGFVRKLNLKYFTTNYLIETQSWTGFPRGGFSKDQLKAQLDAERERRTKLRFTLGGKSINYVKTNEAEPGYKKIKYTVSVTNNNGPYLFTTDQLILSKRPQPVVSGFDSINNQTFDYIYVYYSVNDVPLLVEFVLHTTLRESKKTYFKRVSKDGSKWEHIGDSSGNLRENQKQAVLKEVNYYVGKLIAVYLNKNTSTPEYDLKLFEASDKSSSYSKQKEKITLIEERSAISNSQFKCYHQNFSKSNFTRSKSFITGFKLFFESEHNPSNTIAGDIEIKLFDNLGTTEQTLYYTPGSAQPESNSDLYIYFNAKDNVPLLLHCTGKWYRPNSRAEYFTKWVEVPDLYKVNPKQLRSPSLDENKIIASLEKTNKDLNEIFIEKTYKYGLDSDLKNPANINKTRISLTQEEVNHLYRRVVHKSVTSTSISKIFYRSNELVDDKGLKLSETISSQVSKSYDTVTLYYHVLDLNYTIPLILGVSAGTSSTNHLFYERISKVENQRWKTIPSSEIQIVNGDSELANKINNIHYQFNKSILVQLEEQNADGYNVRLVENHTRTSPTRFELFETGKISVSSESSCLSSSKYKCYKHTIPQITGTTKPFEIGGLRLFVRNKEISTFSTGISQNSQINYIDSKKDLYVYFYDNSKVPLLFRYDSLYYKPSSYSEYFSRWILLPAIPDPSTQLQAHLDEINRTLNVVDISHTSDSSKYGLNVPSGNELTQLDKTFTERISITRQTFDNYGKVTHSTLNKMGLYAISYKNRQILSIEVLPASDKVCVYYHHTDSQFAKPLLISIGVESSSASTKWYYRNKMDVLSWQNEAETTKYNTDLAIKEQLEAIFLKLFTSLTIQAEAHLGYATSIVGSDSTDTPLDGTVKVDPYTGSSYLKINNYICYEHKLFDFYQTHVRSQLTLDLSFSISGKKIGLFDNHESVIPSIKYGSEDLGSKSNIYVYFYAHPTSRTTADTDKVPLIIHLNKKFYGPVSKEKYFDEWKDLNISLALGRGADSETTTSIKSNLDRINSMLNEVEPLKTTHYGISCWDKHSYHKSGNFTSQRIQLSKHTAGDYIFYTHTPINKYKITMIKSLHDLPFNQHSTHLSCREIDEVIVVFKSDNLHCPKLILLNQRARSSYTITYGYYYCSSECSETLQTSQYKQLRQGSHLIGKLNHEDSPLINFLEEDVEPIKSLWSDMIKNEMEPQELAPDGEGDHCGHYVETKLDSPPSPAPNIIELADLSPLRPDLTQHSRSSSPSRASQSHMDHGQGISESGHLPVDSQRFEAERHDNRLSPGTTIQEPQSHTSDQESLKNLDEGSLDDSASTTDGEYYCFGFGDIIKEDEELSTKGPVPSGEDQVQRTTSDHQMSEEHTRNEHASGHEDNEAQSPGLSGKPSVLGLRSEAGSVSIVSEDEIPQYVNTGTVEFDNFMNKIIHYTVKNPYIVGGSCAAAVVTVELGAIGALIYKDFIEILFYSY